MRTVTALTLALGLLATSFTASIAAPVVSQPVIQGSDTAVSQVKMSKKHMMMMKKKKMMMKKKMM